jgi:hypothetical protein
MKLVQPKAESLVPNVLLFGPSKSGKTTGAASAPGGILYMNLDLPNATRFAHQRYDDGHLMEIQFEGLKTMTEVAHTVYDPNQIKMVDAVVVDPISELYRRLVEDLSPKRPDGTPVLSPPLNAYGDAQTHIERFCRHLCLSPVSAIFVCQEIDIKDEASGEVERLPFTGSRSNLSLGRKLMQMVDIVAYTAVLGREEGGKEAWAQLIPARGRPCGDRFDVLADANGRRILDLTEWWQTIGADAPQDETTTNDEGKEAA